LSSASILTASETQCPLRHAADVFPMRAEEFEHDRVIPNTLAAEADADGIVVYGSPKGRAMKSADPRARWKAVNRWLEVAELDRNAAQALLAVPSVRPSAPFHCQQALEKLLKGFLTLAGKRSARHMRSTGWELRPPRVSLKSRSWWPLPRIGAIGPSFIAIRPTKRHPCQTRTN
jgi:hypothetical protein